MYKTTFIVCASCLLLVASSVTAQDNKPVSLKDYGVSEAHPFGRPNPKAPKELQQMDFMIGDFDRKERSRQKDGSWSAWVKGEWNSRYFMNGYAIIDETYNYGSGNTTTNLRFFDAKDKLWKVTWFKEPGYNTTYAEGVKEGDNMVMVQKSSGNRYVFYDIKKDSFEWELQMLRNGDWISVWQISVTRKK